MDFNVTGAVNTIAATNTPIELADPESAQKLLKHGGSPLFVQTNERTIAPQLHHSDSGKKG